MASDTGGSTSSSRSGGSVKANQESTSVKVVLTKRRLRSGRQDEGRYGERDEHEDAANARQDEGRGDDQDKHDPRRDIQARLRRSPSVNMADTRPGPGRRAREGEGNEAELPLGSFFFRIRQKFNKTHCKITLNSEKFCQKSECSGGSDWQDSTSSPAAQFKDSRAALGPAAYLTLEHIGLNLSQTAQSSKGGAFLHKASWQEADFRPAF